MEPTSKISIISMTCGWDVKLDAADFDAVKKYRWVGMKNHYNDGRKYVQRYAYAKIGQKTILMHRVIMGAKKDQIIDHINGDGLDNRRCNLRFVTRGQNNLNRHIIRTKKLPVGVYQHVSGGRFFATIQHRYIGSFNTARDASRAYERERSKVMAMAA